MTEEAFNPKDHMWSFTGYYKFEFSFCTMDEPYYHCHVGGDSGDIYRYEVTPRPMTWEQVTDGGELLQWDWED